MTSNAHGTRKAKVLVVDDVEDIRVVIRHFLGHAGYEAIVAATGTEAIATALSERPDLILLDMQLPDMDGGDAAKRLRSRGFDGSIVAMTGKTLKPGERFSECSGYLRKPIQYDDLMRIVDEKVNAGSKAP